jgi:RNA polymerase sigma factor (TIGR02999 family)
MSASVHDITTYLERSDLNRDEQGELYRLVEEHFRRIADARMRHEQGYHTLQGTVLVTDAFQKLIAAKNVEWENRKQFFCAAAKVMRQLLVDHDRKRRAAKRGGGQRPVDVDRVAEPRDRRAPDPQDLVALNDAVERLKAKHPDWFEVFDLHYFAGLEQQTIADEILNVSLSTVRRRWDMARAFLHRALSVDQPGENADES